MMDPGSIYKKHIETFSVMGKQKRYSSFMQNDYLRRDNPKKAEKKGPKGKSESPGAFTFDPSGKFIS